MLEVELDLPEIYLQPGEVYLARSPTIIRTILGSCIGVAFWSAKLNTGALCHALLPRCLNNRAAIASRAEGYRYVDFSIRDLARRFDKLGALRSELQIKLFGGADVLAISDAGRLRATVGRQNCEAAMEVLRAEGLQLTASSLAGTSGRSIQFYTSTGEVRVRWLSNGAFERGKFGL